MVAQKSPDWSTSGDDLAKSESPFSFEDNEHKAESVRRNGLSLCRGLGARASGSEPPPNGNGPSLPRNEGFVLDESKVAGLSSCVRSARVALLWNCHNEMDGL